MSERDSLRVLRVLTTYFLICCFLTGNVISACASSETSTDSGYSYGNETETSNNVEIDISEDIEAETRQNPSTSQDSLTDSNSLAESDHPYENDFEKTWTISEPGASQIRLHFKDLQLAKTVGKNFFDYDRVLILDRYGNVVEVYGNNRYGANSQDFWTKWYKGDKLSVKLVTDETRPCYGFVIDKMDFKLDESPSVEFKSLAESDHPYENDFEKTWTISEPGASQIRLHFKDLQLAKTVGKNFFDYDRVLILDRYGNVVEVYGNNRYGANSQDFWTKWYKGDKLSVKLVTDETRPCYGFVIDKMDFKLDETNEPSEFVDGKDVSPSESEGFKSRQTEDLRPKQTEKTKNENKGKTSASVQLYGEKTDVTLGEDILLRLSAVNLITKPTMRIQVILLPPSGMSVTSSEFVQSGAGQYTTTYELEPGAGKDIEVRIKSNQIGDFDVNGRVIYYFDGDPDNAEDYTLNLPIKVKEGTPSDSQLPSTDTKNAVQSQNQTKSPGFGSFIAFLGLLTSYTLRKRVP